VHLWCAGGVDAWDLIRIMGDFDNKEREEVFSKKVRAGKRTYFFDVKATRSNDYYVTITESKKRFEDGQFIKHKIFLYKEDFEKFAEGLQDVVEYIKANQEVVEKRYEPNQDENGFENNGELVQKDNYSF
jgi:hypothetical protein